MSRARNRIFVAIALPQRFKNQLLKIQDNWIGLPIRPTKPENLHITLVFLGYMDDQEMYQICKLTRETIAGQSSFELAFNRIYLALDKDSPRMIWLAGEPNRGIAQLKASLEGAYLDSDQSNFTRPEKQIFRPHITLARIKPQDWQRLPNKPIIEEKVDMRFRVDSVQVMQSALKPDGPEYVILESVELE